MNDVYEQNRLAAKEVDALEVSVSEQDKEQFFKAFLEDAPFIQEVEIMGGKVRLEFKTLTLEEGKEVLDQINKDKDAGLTNNDGYMITIAAYRLGLALLKMNGKEVFPDATREAFMLAGGENETYAKFRGDRFLSWTTFKLSAVIEAHRQFESKVMTLSKEVLDQNFWKAGEPI